MAAQLIPGQNAVLTQRVLRFGATGDVALDLSVLVVGDNRIARSSDDFVFYNQPQAAGVRLSGDGVDISLDEVDSAARGLLCIASADPPTTPVPRLSATLTDPTGAVADFAIPLVGLETAVICFELYRRGTDWKVRALGQGYSGGLAQLLDVHGVEVDDAPEPAPVATPPAQADPAIEIEPLDTRRALERMWMIFEDAARSTASVTSSRSYALDRLDNELSMAVADPAMRQSAAGAEARAAAQKRHDDLVAQAESSYQNDAVHLITELGAIDAALPRSLSSWDSPAWRAGAGAALPGNGIRLGVVAAPERELLQIPFCVPAPLRRPLWIDTNSAAAAAPVVTAVVLRLLAATPVPTPILDVVDITGSLHTLTGPLGPLMRAPVVGDHHDISAKLAELNNLADLAELARDSGLDDGPRDDPPARVLVLSDFGHGLTPEDLVAVVGLAGRSAAINLSMVLVGEDASSSSEPLLAALAEHSQHVPSPAHRSTVMDPWTRSEWQFTADCVPTQANRLAQLIDSVIG